MLNSVISWLKKTFGASEQPSLGNLPTLPPIPLPSFSASPPHPSEPSLPLNYWCIANPDNRGRICIPAPFIKFMFPPDILFVDILKEENRLKIVKLTEWTIPDNYLTCLTIDRYNNVRVGKETLKKAGIDGDVYIEIDTEKKCIWVEGAYF